MNAQRLTPDQIAGLERIVHMPVMPGTYWYDNVSGAWGFDGQPLAGFLPAGLKLGGELRADASHGTTGVFINGRQLHVLDVMRLQQWLGTPVMQGRYWVDARGTFGYEGGPPLGNLVAIAQQNSIRLGRQGNTITECSSNGCGSGNSNTGLGVITDGEGHGAVFSDGHVISTP